MENPVYAAAVDQMSALYGQFQPWQRPNGVRRVESPWGSVTIYHNRIAPGNLAEIAFDVDDMAASCGVSKQVALDFLNGLSLCTGRPVKIDAKYRWMRVGLAEQSHVADVVAGLRNFFASRAQPS